MHDERKTHPPAVEDSMRLGIMKAASSNEYNIIIILQTRINIIIMPSRTCNENDFAKQINHRHTMGQRLIMTSPDLEIQHNNIYTLVENTLTKSNTKKPTQFT